MEAADRSSREGAYILEEFQLYGSGVTRFLWPLVQNFRHGVNFVLSISNKQKRWCMQHKSDIGEWPKNA